MGTETNAVHLEANHAIGSTKAPNTNIHIHKKTTPTTSGDGMVGIEPSADGQEDNHYVNVAIAP